MQVDNWFRFHLISSKFPWHRHLFHLCPWDPLHHLNTQLICLPLGHMSTRHLGVYCEMKKIKNKKKNKLKSYQFVISLYKINKHLLQYLIVFDLLNQSKLTNPDEIFRNYPQLLRTYFLFSLGFLILSVIGSNL